MKKRKGQISFVSYIFLLLFVVIMICYQIQLDTYDAIRTRTQDALSSSNLASAVIDIEQYGINHDILIKDPAASYVLWQGAFRANMGLKTDWTPESADSPVSGRVDVIEYTVYNVKGNDIYVYSYGQSPYQTVHYGGLGSVKAPNGRTIESTSIYSRVTFPVQGLFGINTTADKAELVDIVRQDV